MSNISEQLPEKMKDAMRAKDSLSLNTYRALKTALTNAAIQKGSLTTVLDDAEQLAVVRKQIKQRQDAAEQFKNAGREELQAKEEAEIKVLEQFVPAALSEEEAKAILEKVIAETGAVDKKDMGKVMKAMQEHTQGRVDGKQLSQWVAARLS